MNETAQRNIERMDRGTDDYAQQHKSTFEYYATKTWEGVLIPITTSNPILRPRTLSPSLKLATSATGTHNLKRLSNGFNSFSRAAFAFFPHETRLSIVCCATNFLRPRALSCATRQLQNILPTRAIDTDAHVAAVPCAFDQPKPCLNDGEGRVMASRESSLHTTVEDRVWGELNSLNQCRRRIGKKQGRLRPCCCDPKEHREERCLRERTAYIPGSLDAGRFAIGQHSFTDDNGRQGFDHVCRLHLDLRWPMRRVLHTFPPSGLRRKIGKKRKAIGDTAAVIARDKANMAAFNVNKAGTGRSACIPEGFVAGQSPRD
jgi:hypothetical protein